jgi:hypothetical protein
LIKSIILSMMLLLLAGIACAASGYGSITVDVLGSKVDNTKIVSSGGGPIDLEFLGSTAKGTYIGPPMENIPGCYINCTPCMGCGCEAQKCPWDQMHLGVDAWYGTFWYRNVNMPRWPATY